MKLEHCRNCNRAKETRDVRIHLQALLETWSKNTGSVETPANRYGTGKTQEQSSEQAGSIGGKKNPGGKTKRDNQNTR